MKELDYYCGKVCIITGGNSGIGLALVQRLLSFNAKIYIADLKTDTVEKLPEFGEMVFAQQVDVTAKDQIAGLIKQVICNEGRIDFLFNNAGIGGTKPYNTATLENWETIINVNLWSVIYGIHYALPQMEKQGYGHIINTSSISGIIPIPFQALYSLTKFGVTGLTESLRYEYAEKGISFTTVCPSNIATPIFKKSLDGKVHDNVKIPDDAIPVAEAAALILMRVAEKKGIVCIPEDNLKMWQGYVMNDPVTEKQLMDLAATRRMNFESTGSYF